MLKLSASYSKKVPAGEEFSSQSFHCAVEVELPDGLSREELDKRIHETFGLVKYSVDTELASVNANGFGTPAPRAQQFPAQNARKQQPASARQLSYLCDIAARNGMSPGELEAEIASRFGVRALNQLTREDASHMIEFFRGGSSSRQRGRAA